ncbi:MAG: hypothetical protein KDC52_02520, partial [Ignavibacteriae bacterium]|nr:hypothetical protein [Ignavibacteriota bacterium]
TFTYFIKEVPKTLKEVRQEKEKELFKDGKPIPQATNEELREEKNEVNPYLVFTITEMNNNEIRKLTAEAKKGIQRLTWDLRYESLNPLNDKDKFDPKAKPKSSTLVFPGKYKVAISLVTREGEKKLSENVEFNVVPLNNKFATKAEREELIAFQQKANSLTRTISGTENYLKELISKVDKIKQQILITPSATYEFLTDAEQLEKQLDDIYLLFNRESNFPSTEENPPSPMTINERLAVVKYTHYRSTEPVTEKEKVNYEVLVDEFPAVYERIKNMGEYVVKNLETKLEKLGAPVTPGQLPELKLN